MSRQKTGDEALQNFIAKMNAAKNANDAKAIVAHSWFGRSCHVVRSGGHVRRGRIGPISYAENQALVEVTYKPRGKKNNVKTMTSLLAIVCAEKMWHSYEIISDSDVSEDDKETFNLPVLQIDAENKSVSKMNESDAFVLGRAAREVNHLKLAMSGFKKHV
jgi:RNase P/RNase MRP subunit p29